MPFLFEDLQVYQKAVDFAERISCPTQSFPRGFFYLSDQLNRASLSIAANIAEGNGRFTRGERRSFFGIARGSAQECVPLLEIGRRRGLLTDAEAEQSRAKLEEISRMLSGLIKGLERRQT
jgi:four helix bundle protein